MHFSVAFLLALATSASSLPTAENSASNVSFESSIVESISSPPAGWIKDDGAKLDKDSHMVKLQIKLVHQDMDKFHNLAMKIATPGNELYGSHLDQKVIDDMIAPKDDSSKLVMEWLSSEGLSSHASISQRSDAVIVDASVTQIEKLLKAKYMPFSHKETGESAVRTLEYSLPDMLKEHVEMVQPTTFFGLRAMRSTILEHHPLSEADFRTEAVQSGQAVQAVTGCTGTTITPKCLSNLYSYASASVYSNGLMGIAGFLKQWPIKTDLATFMKTYATQGNAAQSFTCTLINGGTCPQTSTPGIEANLDVQYVRAITQSIPNVYYSVGGSPPWLGTGTNTNEPYLEFLNYLLGLDASALPNTISISYGDDEDTVPLSYATNVCNLFAQLGARGVSVLVASGDSGVGDTCKSGTTKTFTTSFPASCPWVTTVGGTTGNSPEGAWTGSGGGFSSRFGQPSYQTAAVNKWLTTDTTHVAVNQYFNQSGRAYPDISAQSTNFAIVASGSTQGVSGTSAACPTFASIIQLLNSDRLLAGKKPLGFLNPWLYNSATPGLTDITKGKNTGCSGVISGAGFSAVPGWDPATGLGTPIYTSLLAISKNT
ncbi:probable tripeptidyl-peptidase 1 precursor [Rhynchosporium secalis]|uniref:tripeptidyl-peptidase II n=1 Tax=Rhynchosporium secalis TaxID=38038 RepID=A0A1E1MTT8_RHYSE|nr:probable tripeptidyl-peptidase 1 precursor [Rhynchosporium secalis]